MQTLITLQTNAPNIYTLTNKLTLAQTQTLLEVAVVLGVLGFFLAEHTMLSGIHTWLAGFLPKRAPSTVSAQSGV